MTLKGQWKKESFIDQGDVVRVIGEFNHENQYHLELSDDISEEEAKKNDKARFLILEPEILLPVTTIVKSFPCIRKPYIDMLFKENSKQNYACILGTIVHQIFQQLLEINDFSKESVESIKREAITA